MRITPESGKTVKVEVNRTILAKRLGRLTGSGLFTESQKTGRDWTEIDVAEERPLSQIFCSNCSAVFVSLFEKLAESLNESTSDQRCATLFQAMAEALVGHPTEARQTFSRLSGQLAGDSAGLSQFFHETAARYSAPKTGNGRDLASQDSNGLKSLWLLIDATIELGSPSLNAANSVALLRKFRSLPTPPEAPWISDFQPLVRALIEQHLRFEMGARKIDPDADLESLGIAAEQLRDLLPLWQPRVAALFKGTIDAREPVEGIAPGEYRLRARQG